MSRSASSTTLLFLGALLAGCPTDKTSDSDDTVDHTDSTQVDGVPTPTIRFANPSPTTVDDLELVIEDLDETRFQYKIGWSQDGTNRSELTDHATVPASATTKGQAWSVEVYAISLDNAQESDKATASITIANALPVATVVVDPEAPTTGTDLQATITTTDADDDPVTTRTIWKLDGDATNYVDVDTIAAATLKRGQVWRVEVTPNDGEADGEVVSDEVTVVNSPPIVSSATISPSDPDTTASLTAVYVASDPDGDTNLKPEITWYVDGAPQARTTPQATLNETLSHNLQEVFFEVRVQDPSGDWSEVKRSDPITIRDTAATSSGAHLEPAAGDETTTFTCVGDGFDDFDGDEPGWKYAWQVDGVEIPGQTGPTLTGASFARGDRITCSAAPWGGHAAGYLVGPALVSDGVTIDNAPPTTANVVISPVGATTLQVGKSAKVTFDRPADPDGDPVTYAVRWYVDDVKVDEGDDLTTLSTGFAVASHVKAEVVPRDPFRAGTAVTSNVLVVSNGKPVISGAALAPADVFTNTDLYAQVTASDPDGQPLSIEYNWFVDGTLVLTDTRPYGTDGVLASSRYVKGNVLRVTLYAKDTTGGRSAPYTAGPVTVKNTVPTLQAVSLTPLVATESTTLTCTPVGFADADEGDSPAYTYRWTVAGRVVSGATGATLTGLSFKRGDEVTCAVTPGDGTVSGTAVTSPSVTIQDAAPSIAGATLSSTTPYVLDPPLSVRITGATDPDADPVTFEYRWMVDGVQKATTSTFSPALARPGQQITCQVTPYDGTLRGTPITTPAAVVQDTPPTIDEIYLTPATPSVLDTLQANVITTDADGDTLTTTFSWTVDGAVVPGVTGSTLPPGHTVRDQEVVVTAHVDDGHGGTADRTSAPIVIGNAPPSVAGAHIEPALIYEDTVARCVPDGASDPDGDALTFLTEWFKNGTRVSLQDTLTGNSFAHGDTLKCRVKPLDLDTSRPGAAAESAGVVVENTPPVLASATLTDTAPREATVLGVVPGSSSDLDGDTLTWRVHWLVDGVEVATTATLDGASFDKGQHVQALVVPWDGFDEGTGVATDEALVVNTAPVVVAIDLSPGAPTVADTITAAVETSDADDDAVDLTYQWWVDGAIAQEGASATLPPTAFHQGSSVKVVVTAADDEVSSQPVTSSTIVVGNAPPSITGVVVNPTSADEKTTLTCSATGWYDPDGDPPSYQYRWYVDGVLKVGTATITGTSFSRGNSVVCKVRPYDGKAFGTELSSTPIVVQNTPPSGSNARLSSSAPREGDTLSVVIDGVEDADGDAVTRTYQWLVDGAQVSTASTLTGASFDKGDRIQAKITLSDGVVSVTYTTAEVTAVNTAPVVTTLSLSPAVPIATDDIVATASASDPDPGDVVTLAYAWNVGGVALASPTDAVLPHGSFHKHQEVYVTVTANDGTASGAPRTSSSVSPVNSAPTVASVVIEPGSVDRRIAPTCVATGLADLDGDTVAIRYRWTKNGQTVSAQEILTADRFARGDTLRCYVSGYDGEDTGAEAVSQVVVVDNAPPTVVLVQLVPPDPQVVDVIQADITLDDADGDLPSWRYVWRVNGVAVSVESRIDSTWFQRGDTVQLEVIPNDGIEDGPSGFSPEVTIRNTEPTVSRAVLNPQEFRTNDTVGVDVTADDAEGDPITLSYTWYVDGVAVQSGAQATLSGATYFSKGQQVWVEVTASDPYDVGETRAAPARTVLNSSPTSPTVKLSPTSPEPAYDDVVCSIDTPSTDPDGDTVYYEFAWYNDIGTQYPHTYGATSTFPKDQTWNRMVLLCSAQASDGENVSAWSPQASVTLELFVRTSCQDWFHKGATADGVYELDWDGHGGPQPPLYVTCDMEVNGGWTLVMRTTTNAHNFGQNTSSIVSSFVPDTSAYGVFDAFRYIDDYTLIRLKQTAGAQAGRYRSFYFPANNGKTLLEILQGCRDDPLHPNDDTYWATSSSTRHTDNYTGLAAAGGDLAVYRDDGTSKPVSHFFACGVNDSDDNDVAYLSFSDDQGAFNTWGDNWRGTTQIGTIWSFANGNYNSSSSRHIGGGTMEAFAGWKGTSGQPSGSMHAGTYEIWIQ
jgi:hypothetical protein